MTIKETAGKVLLYFYQLQRTAPLAMPNRQLGFINKKEGLVGITSDKQWFTKDLQILNPNAADTYNAFRYLLDRKLIQSTDRATGAAKVYVGVHVTHKGIDLIEGVENGPQGQELFAESFAMHVPADGGVEALMKDALSALLD